MTVHDRSAPAGGERVQGVYLHGQGLLIVGRHTGREGIAHR